MRIAIFGGSFDPPHIGHEAIIHEACKCLDVEKVFVVPTFLNPFKNSAMFDAPTRLNLIKKLFNDEKKVDVCDYEVKQNRAVNTIETVVHLNAQLKPSKIYLIIGADNFKCIHTWNNYEQLKELVEFVVAKRECTKEHFENTQMLDINIDISSSILRQSLNLDYIPKKIQTDVNLVWQIKKAK